MSYLDSGLVLKSIHLPKEQGQSQEVTLEQLQVFKVWHVFAFLMWLDNLCNLKLLTFDLSFSLSLSMQHKSPVTALTLSKKKVWLLWAVDKHTYT